MIAWIKRQAVAIAHAVAALPPLLLLVVDEIKDVDVSAWLKPEYLVAYIIGLKVLNVYLHYRVDPKKDA